MHFLICLAHVGDAWVLEIDSRLSPTYSGSSSKYSCHSRCSPFSEVSKHSRPPLEYRCWFQPSVLLQLWTIRGHLITLVSGRDISPSSLRALSELRFSLIIYSNWKLTIWLSHRTLAHDFDDIMPTQSRERELASMLTSFKGDINTTVVI